MAVLQLQSKTNLCNLLLVLNLIHPIHLNNHGGFTFDEYTYTPGPHLILSGFSSQSSSPHLLTMKSQFDVKLNNLLLNVSNSTPHAF